MCFVFTNLFSCHFLKFKAFFLKMDLSKFKKTWDFLWTLSVGTNELIYCTLMKFLFFTFHLHLIERDLCIYLIWSLFDWQICRSTRWHWIVIFEEQNRTCYKSSSTCFRVLFFFSSVFSNFFRISKSKFFFDWRKFCWLVHFTLFLFIE